MGFSSKGREEKGKGREGRVWGWKGGEGCPQIGESGSASADS